MNITNQDLEEIKKQATESMSSNKDRQVEIFKSCDPQLTGIYFSSERGKSSEFELVCFGYDHNKSQYFLKYPNSEYYIELYASGNSGRGTMNNIKFRNIFYEYRHPFIYEGKQQAESGKILKHDNNAVIIFDKYQSEFNFLKRIAAKNFTKYGNQNDDDYAEFGNGYINEMLQRKYVPIPNKSRIEEAFQTTDNKIVVLEAPAYKYAYEELKCYYGDLDKEMKLGKISNFRRYRDGGTTIFDVEIDNKKYEYFSPTKLGNNGFGGKTKAEWNKSIMNEVSEDRYPYIAEKLGIDLVTEVQE